MQVVKPSLAGRQWEWGSSIHRWSFVPGGWRHKGIIGQQWGDADTVPALHHITSGRPLLRGRDGGLEGKQHPRSAWSRVNGLRGSRPVRRNAAAS